jgi:hypothetical protein
VNLGTEPNRFSIQIFDGKTGVQAGRVEDITVKPRGSFRLNSLLPDYAPGVSQGYAGVLPNNTEPFVTYVVIIDGVRPGERTGTPALSIAHHEQVRFGEMKLRGHCNQDFKAHLLG